MTKILMVPGIMRFGLGAESGHRMVLVAFLTLVLLISGLSYGPMLSQFFTGTDTITLIETSRINDNEDLSRILLNPLMHGSPFVEVARFYRPISTMTYSFDYWLWGMNPFGFHLTNLILHSSAAILILWLVLSVAPHRILAAGFSGIAFALHPILVETVPSLDRRHDILAAIFMLLCVIFLAKYLVSLRWRKTSLFVSILCQIGAMASKETAFFVPVLLVAFVWLFNQDAQSSGRMRSAVRYVSPHLLCAVIYFAWRLFVLDGLGGYRVETVGGSLWEKIHYLGGVVLVYAADLISPVDGVWEPIMTRGAGIVLSGIALALGPILACSLRKDRTADVGTFDTVTLKFHIFMIFWVLLPLGVFSLSLTFAHRSMYIPVIGLCCLIGLNIEYLAAFLVTKPFWKGHNRISGSMVSPILRALPVKVSAVAAVFMMCVFLRYSPLVCHYGAWYDSAQLSSHLLRQLVTSIAVAPQKSLVVLNEVPNCLMAYQNVRPTVKEVAFLQSYSFDSWLKLVLPRNHPRIVMGRRSQPQSFSGLARLSYCLWGKRTLIAFVSLGRKGPSTRALLSPDYFW